MLLALSSRCRLSELDTGGVTPVFSLYLGNIFCCDFSIVSKMKVSTEKEDTYFNHFMVLSVELI